jgi:hypothetical protein
MPKPISYADIFKEPLTQAQVNQFLAEQEFIRDLEWHAKHADLFAGVN